LLNEYYSTLTAQQQKLLQEKTTPAFRALRTRDSHNSIDQQLDYSRYNRIGENEQTDSNSHGYGLRSNSPLGSQPLHTEEIRQQI